MNLNQSISIIFSQENRSIITHFIDIYVLLHLTNFLTNLLTVNSVFFNRLKNFTLTLIPILICYTVCLNIFYS